MIKKGFSYLGISFLNFLALLPLSILYPMAALCYYPMYYLLRYRRKVVRENLCNSFPEKPLPEIIRVEKQFYKYLCELSAEIVKIPGLSKQEFDRRVRFSNLDIVTPYFEKGQSILVCTGHYGNWEWGMLTFGFKVPAASYVIYKPVNNQQFDQWFLKSRSKFGNQLVSMRQTLRAIAGSRESLSVFAFAGDQTPVKHEARHWLTFLHQPTAVLTGMEKISLQTGRPVFYFKINRVRRGHYQIDCIPLATNPATTAPGEITARSFRILEEMIKEAPPYWLWSHRRWKHKPENPTWNPA